MDFKFNFTSTNTDSKTVPMDENKIYDVIIIGGGPAGLTASVYCMRKGIQTGLITLNIGGQVAETASIENYMGYRYIEGMQLVDKFREQVKQFEIGLKENVKVISIKDGDLKEVYLADNSKYRSKAIIISSGKSPRHMNVPGEKNLLGKGIAFCATCDAPLYKNMEVAVVGGGNSGVEAAIELARIAKQVTVIQQNGILTSDNILTENLNKFNNVNVLYNSKVIEIKGNKKVESIAVKNILNNEQKSINVDGVFVEIGLNPNSDFVKGLLKLNELEEIIVDCECNTNIPGIFACGDVTNVKYKQIIIAAGEGSKASLSANEYILKK